MTASDVRRLAACALRVFVVALAAAAPAQGQEPREDVRQRTSRRQAQPVPASGERPGILERLADFTGGRLQVHVNGAYRYFSRRSETETTFRAYGEEARFLTRQEFRGGAHVDAGGTVRVWRALALGASYSQVTNDGAAAVTGTVPHPLETGNDRTAPEQTLALAQRQRATHAYVAWRVRLFDTFEVDFSAGPTYFNLRQGVVANLIPVETSGPPFPEVALEVETGEHTRNGVGYNAGVDVTFVVIPATQTQVLNVGIGWFARVSGGSVALPADAGPPRTVPVGGFQTGAGLRLRF